MKRYLRLGEIPTNERSINWRELTFEQRELITYDISCGMSAHESIINYIKSGCKTFKGVDINKIFEAGVSVFELDDNNKPIFDNDKLLRSYEIRQHEKRHIVTGDVVGTGEDGEPLLINIKEVK